MLSSRHNIISRLGAVALAAQSVGSEFIRSFTAVWGTRTNRKEIGYLPGSRQLYQRRISPAYVRKVPKHQEDFDAIALAEAKRKLKQRRNLYIANKGGIQMLTVSN